MRMQRREFLAGLLGLACALPGIAQAQSADALRSSGQAGERFDGFMEARDASVAGAVNQINAQRREVYEKRDQQEGVSIDQVGRVFAHEIYRKAAPGTYFRSEGGSWTQK